MPNSVDTRVVEMRFDNAQFEKNIHQSMKSLEQLDKSLEFKNTGKGVKDLEKNLNNIDVSKLDQTLTKIEKRFSTLGIMGATVASEITKSFIGLGKNLYNNTIGQIKAGGMSRALNIESAKFQLEGLGVKWAQIEKDINYGVKDTAYGLDAAAKAAAQLTASGIQLGEEMQKSLRGISGVAAMTNASYEEISPIFTTIAGQGKVMTMQLRQLEARGLNAAATLAKALGKTEAEIRDMVTKGEIDFKTFANVMDDAFGAHAKDANKTFTGALSNMKAALSRIGADFATPYMENARAVFVTVTGVIDGIRKQLKPFITRVSDWMYQLRLTIQNTLRSKDFVETYTRLFHGLGQAFRLITSLINPLAIAFRNVFPKGLLGTLKGVAIGFDNLATNASFSSEFITMFIDVFEALFSILKAGGIIIGNIFELIKPGFKYLKPIGEFVVKLTSSLAKLITQLTKVITGSEKFKSLGSSIKNVLKIIGDSILKIIDKFTDFVNSAEGAKKIEKICSDLGDAFNWLGDIATKIFGGMGLLIVGTFTEITDFFKKNDIPKYITSFKDKMEGLNTTAELGTGFLGKFVKIFSGGFRNIPKNVYAAGKSFNALNKAVDKNVKSGGIIPGLTKFSNSLDKISTSVGDLGTTIMNNVKAFGLGRGIIVAFSASIVGLIFQTAGLVGNLKKAFKGVPSLISAFTRSFNLPWFEIKAKAIIAGFVLGILSLAGALWILSKIPADRLWDVTGALAAIIGTMTAAGILINLLGGGFSKFKDVALSFAAFAGSIFILTLAFQQINNMKVNDGWQLFKNFLALAGIMAAMAGVIIAVTQLSKPFSILFGSGFMLAFALSVNLLVKALKAISELDVDKVKKSVSVLLEIMGTLGGVALAVTFLSPLAGVGFLGIVLGMLALVKGISMLSDIDVQNLYRVKHVFEDMLKALSGWFKVFAIIQLLRILVSGVKAVADLINAIKNPLKGINKGIKELGKAAEIAAVGATFLMIAQGIYILSTIDENKFWQAVNLASSVAAGIIFVSVILTGLSTMLPEDNIFKSIGKTLQGIGVLLIGVGVALKIIDSLSDPGYAIIMMAGLLGLLYLFVRLLSALQEANPMVAMGMKTAAALGAVLLALTICIGILSMIASTPGGMSAVVSSALMLAIVIGTMAGVLAALGTIKNWAPALTATLGMAAVIGALGGVFYLLRDVDASRMWGQGVYILLAVGILSGIMALLGNMDITDAGTAVAIMATVAGVFIIMAGVAAILQQIDTKKFIENLAVVGSAMGILLIVITAIAIATVVTGGIAAGALAIAVGILLALSVAMITMAAAGLIFSAAAYILVAAFNILVDVLIRMQTQVQFDVIADGIKKIGESGVSLKQFISVGAVIALLAGLGIVLAFVWPVMALATPVITMFSEAFLGMGKAMEEFAKLDFTGYLGNIAAFAGTLVALTLILPDLLAVAGGLREFASGISAIENYTASLAGNLDQISLEIDKLKKLAEPLVQVMKDFPQAIQDACNKLNENTLSTLVSNMADGMIRASDALMPNVGQQIVDNIQNGFDSEAFQPVDKTSEMINDFIDGLVTGADGREGELKALGEYIAQHIIEGSRGPGGFNENSPSKEAIEEMMFFILGLKNEAEVSDKTLKEIGEFIGQDITRESLKEFKDGKKDITQMFEGLLSSLQDIAAQNGIQIPVDFKVRSVPQFSDNDTYDLRTVSGYNTSLASIPGYTSFNREKAKREKYGITSVYDTIKTQSAIDNLKNETGALGGNTKATKGNSAAKKENEKANDGKTKAIDEETESLEGEEEQTEETSEDIRAMAEQIEVVTEEYNKFNHYIGINTKLLKKGRFKQYAKNTEKLATATYTSLSQITQAFRQMSKGIKATTRVSDRGLYKFGEGLKKVDKLYKANKIKKSSAAIEKYIAKTGRSIAKVSGDVVKVFYKDGNRMSKIYFNAAKNIQKVPKQFKKAMDTAKFFANDMNETINKYDWSDEPIEHLRMIEESFGKVKFGKMTKGVSEYLRNIKHRFDELDPTMRQISKELGGTFNVLSKNSRVVPATMDALVSLGAVLYNGSDAANEYATKIAQLEFLYEHNEISWEELQEAKIDYLTRIKDALVEYKQTLDETYNSEVDMFTAFNKNELEKTENIVKNQMSNIAGYYTYGEMLNEFARRGPALEQTGQIIKQLAEGGVQNFGKLRAILKLTDQELKAFVYGYGVLTKTQEETANKAMAAIALSTSYADKRQQALTKDIKKKTTQYSAQVRKMIESDMYAVAQAATQTNKLRKKDEKEYLKTLTKKEKATYKQYKRELNAAKKAFNKQQKLLKSQEQIDNTFKNIKSIDAFIEAMQKYSDNAYFMSQINEKLEDSLEEVIKGVGGTTDATIDLLKLAKEFGAEGKDIDSIISSVSDKINSWRDGIKNATKDVKNFFDEFKRGDAINPNKVLSNFANRVSAIAEFSSGFGKLTSMGFSGKIVKWVGELYSSNMEEALRYIQAFMVSDAKQVQLWNEYFDEVEKLSEDVTNKAVKAASESNKKSDTQLAFEAASARVIEAEKALKRFQNDETKYAESMARYTQLVIQNGSEMNQAFMEMDKSFNTADAYSKAANGAFHSIFTQIPYYAKEGIDEIANLTGVSLEKKLSLMQDYTRRYYQTEEYRFYKNQKDELERTIANLANVDASDVQAMMAKQQAMSKLKHLEEEYAKTTGGYIDKVQQQMKADKAAAEAALNKANAELSVAAAEEQLRKDTEALNKQDAEAIIQQERNYQDYTRDVINLDDAQKGYIATIRKNLAVSGVLVKALERIRAATDKVKKAVEYARTNFGTMFGRDGLVPMGDLLIPEIDLIAEGFLRLAETLESVNDETDDFIENMGNRLEAYRKTLYDTLNTQSSLFDEFKKFSGDKATGATTYLDNMKSQVDAIEEWTTNMENLARRGVSGEILKMFASEGVSSYEKVAAFASATAEELAELNARYREYAKLVDDATDRTLATLGYAFTTTAQTISKNLADSFKERASSELQEAAYVAGTMVITGVKDGLSNASPQIVAEVEGVANKITTTMSETLTADAIEESIRKGLVTMSGAIQNTVGVIVSDFLDSVTNTSIQKFKMAVDSAKNYVQQTLPTDYTITIHVDTSEMDAAIARMNGAISGTYVTANQTSSAVVASQEHQAPIVPLNDTQPTNNTVVNYTQNNYSPKSLSRADIYRQTQNQLSTIAGVVSSATP